jgi:hypothetical protein
VFALTKLKPPVAVVIMDESALAVSDLLCGALDLIKRCQRSVASKPSIALVVGGRVKSVEHLLDGMLRDLKKAAHEDFLPDFSSNSADLDYDIDDECPTPDVRPRSAAESDLLAKVGGSSRLYI